jgi:hypothetical protein
MELRAVTPIAKDTDSSALAEIHGFDSPAHFSTVCRTMDERVRRGELSPVPVEHVYASEMFEETWYRTPTGETWRLVSPEFPFKGVLERVS